MFKFRVVAAILVCATTQVLADHQSTSVPAKYVPHISENWDLARTNHSTLHSNFSRAGGTNVSLDPGKNYPAGDTPVGFCYADVNGDGKPDIIAGNRYVDSITVLYNRGDGSFATSANFSAGEYPSWVCAADVSGDLLPDILSPNMGSGNVSVLINQGAGSFAPAVNYAVQSASYDGGPWAVIAVEMNGDTMMDIVTSNYTGNTVSVLINQGNGTFADAVSYPVHTWPTPIVSADFNRDGHADIVTGCYLDSTVAVLMGNGDGTVQTAVYYPVDHPEFLSQADFDGDGWTDIAVASNISHANNLSILKNNGDGTFTTSSTYYAGSCPQGVFSADIDGDSDQDLMASVVFDNAVYIFLNVGNGNFTLGPVLGGNFYPNGVVAVDLNGDSRLDVVSEGYLGNCITVFMNGSVKDADHDGVVDTTDNCPLTFNPVQEDSDGNGIGDSCTLTAASIPLGTNVNASANPSMSFSFDSVTQSGAIQVDSGNTGLLPPSGFIVLPANLPTWYQIATSSIFSDSVTICISYSPVDGIPDTARLMHFSGNPPEWHDVTSSHDTVAHIICGRVTSFSPFLLTHGPGTPSNCCVGTTGNVNSSGIVDLSDLSALVGYLTGGGYVLPCQAEANVNSTGIVDLSDLSSMVSYLTGGGYILPNCP